MRPNTIATSNTIDIWSSSRVTGKPSRRNFSSFVYDLGSKRKGAGERRLIRVYQKGVGLPREDSWQDSAAIPELGYPPPLGVFGQNPEGNRVKGRDPEPNL